MWDAVASLAQLIGRTPPASASWGHCEIDYPREAIVSPYPFKTAQEHYEALLAETQAQGGPTIYTREHPPPDWNGRYSRAISLEFMARRGGKTYEAPPAYLAEPPQWFFTSINQTSTILSLLTPEYQRRTVQMHYHQSVDNAPLWPGQFCWPDGFMRVFSRQAHLAMDFVDHARTVQLMASSAENFIRHFNVGRAVRHERRRAAARRGRATLVRRERRVLGPRHADHLDLERDPVDHAWRVRDSRARCRPSRSSRRAATPTGKLAGIEHEIILYDPEAFVAAAADRPGAHQNRQSR